MPNSHDAALADQIVQQALVNFIRLPEVSDRASRQPGDMALDVIVPEFDFGAFHSIGPIPVTWRPGLTLTARLFDLESGQTKFAVTVKHREAWHEWGRKVVSPRSLFSLQPLMTREETELMTIAAATKMLTRVSAAM